MNTKEPRRIWLITKDGVPQECAWAMVKTAAEAGGAGSWACALSPTQLLADGWDAAPTQWRRVPKALQPGMATSAVISGRKVTCHGMEYNLDTGGRVHSGHNPDDEREPYEPDVVIVDEDALLSAIEAMSAQALVDRTARIDAQANSDALRLGLNAAEKAARRTAIDHSTAVPAHAELQLVERDTLKRVRVSADPVAVNKGENSLIHREAGAKKRTERP